jgi:hypothetical protein
MPNSAESPSREILFEPFSRLPQELVDMVFSYADIETLRFCSLTCRNWYYAAVCHFHYSLKMSPYKTLPPGTHQEWLNPLLKAHEIHLLPSITRFSILFYTRELTRELFGGEQNLRYFSALENLQEFRVEGLKISNFMPGIEQYFGHFPALRSLTLEQPEASYRQLLYFIGLFPKLRDLKLINFHPTTEDETAVKSTLVPPSKPPLDGWLTLAYCWGGGEFVNEIVALYGKLPFRCANLSCLKFTQRVLDECAETLETLQLYPVMAHDRYSENFSGSLGGGRTDVNDFVVWDLLCKSRLNLSRHESLRTLRLAAGRCSTDPNDARALEVINNLLSTIQSSSQLDVVIVYYGIEFPLDCAKQPPGHAGLYVGESTTKSGCECEDCNRNLGRLKVLAKAYGNRKFRLVLCVEAPGAAGWNIVRALELQVEAHRDRELRLLLSGSSIISAIPHFSSGRS